MANWAEKRVTDQWTFFSEYWNVNILWCVRTEPERHIRIGTGVMMWFGRNSGRTTDVKNVGCGEAGPLGSVHIRVTDGRGPCTVRYAEFGHELASSATILAQGAFALPGLNEPWGEKEYLELKRQLGKSR